MTPPPPRAVDAFLSLDPTKIVETAVALQARVSERFPGAGLSRVADALVALAHEATATARSLTLARMRIRVAALSAIGLLCALVLIGVARVISRLPDLSSSSLVDLFQGVDAAINDFVFVGVAIFFLLGWERRVKRSDALATIRKLRALSHIIDMHQLTKDPERVGGRGSDTGSSPTRSLTPFQLVRYLDYCSEMLALISKLAALLVQGFDDPVTLSAVDEIEDLTAGLSRKIWQKIMIIDRVVPEASEA